MMDCPLRYGFWLVACGVVLSPEANAAQREAVASDLVRWDWYFRESLVAIRDWETTLERLEKEGHDDHRPSRFPIPMDGRLATWPNPVDREA